CLDTGSDDRPTTQKEYAGWLCERMRIPLPGSSPAFAPGVPRVSLRGRRVRNDKLKRELELTLRYPTYVEGEAAIEAEERGECSPEQTVTAAATPSLAAVTPAAAPATAAPAA